MSRNRRDLDSNDADVAPGVMPSGRSDTSVLDRIGPVVAGVLVPLFLTYPLVARLSRGFFAFDQPPLTRSGIVPGDHLVNFYRFWLFSDGLAHRTARLHDPYAFALVGRANDPPLGWIFGLPFAVLERLAGVVTAYNLLVFLALGLSFLFGYLWLRALGLPAPAATAGAVALVVFPASYARLTVHIKAFFFWLMPLALFLVERARRSSTSRSRFILTAGAGLATVALLTVVEPETAVYFWPVLLLYAVGRAGRDVWLGLGAGVALSIAYLGWFYAAVVGPSVNSNGRTVASLMRYSPGLGDLFTRAYDAGNLERYLWPGVGALLAVYGAVCLWRSAAPLGPKLAISAVPLILVAAMGPRAPLVGGLYRFLFEHISAFRVVQTPGRAVFVVGPLVGLGVAFGFDSLLAPVRRRRVWAACAVLAVVLVLDARAVTWQQSRPLRSSTVAALAGAKGIIDVPVTNGLDYLGSVYDYGITRAPAPRAGGMTPYLTRRQIVGFNRVVSLGGGTVDPAAVRAACAMGATHVVLWEDMFGRGDLPIDARAAFTALSASRDLQLLSTDEGIDVFRLRC